MRAEKATDKDLPKSKSCRNFRQNQNQNHCSERKHRCDKTGMSKEQLLPMTNTSMKVLEQIQRQMREQKLLWLQQRQKQVSQELLRKHTSSHHGDA